MSLKPNLPAPKAKHRTMSLKLKQTNLNQLVTLNHMKMIRIQLDQRTSRRENEKTSKRKRGPTVGRGLMKTLAGSSTKMKIDVDPEIGRPRNRKQSAKFSSQIRVVARDVLPVVRKWNEIKEQSALDPCIGHMQIHLDVNMDKPGVKECVIDRLKTSYRQQRHRLHKHYLRFPNMEEGKKKLPPSLGADQQEKWNSLCEYFNSPEFKNHSLKNKANRNKVKAPHGTGRTSFCVIQNELAESGKPSDVIAMYEETHKNADGGWKTEDAELNFEIMIFNQFLYAEEGIEKTEREIVSEVLGPACGYIKGVGYGPKPPGKCSRQLQQQLQAAREDLEESRSEATFFKNMVETLKEQLNDQAKQVKDQEGSCLSKLMALAKDGGHFADSGRADRT